MYSQANECIGCASTDIFKKSGRMHCKNCGLEFDEKMGGLNYSNAYSDEKSLYATHFKNIDHFQTMTMDKLIDQLLPFEKHLYEFIKSQANCNNLVDLGCGTGRFLRASELAVGSSQGYEVAQILVTRLKEHGRKVIKGGIDEFLDTPIEFDVVTLLEVVEHLAQPGVALRKILQLKAPRFLAVVVPCWHERRKYDGHFAGHDVPPNHLSWWNKSSLTAAMTSSGYDVKIEFIPEKRSSLVKHFVKNFLRGGATATLSEWVKAIINPPNFWLLAIAEKNENKNCV